MKVYITVLLIGLCVLGMPITSLAALDWQIRWDDTDSPQTAKVHIFNPENTYQTFSLEIGDVAQSSDPDPNIPLLIIGQDVFVRLAPSERKIFDIIVYQDIDPYSLYVTASEGKTYLLTDENYRLLRQNYELSASSRQYPYAVQKITPVGRDDGDSGTRYSYRSGRGYWKISLADHDHIIEQLIRTGDRMGALHSSIQQAILFYTQGNMALTDEALDVWENAFPELDVSDVTPDPTPGNCTRFVTVVTTNLSYYPSSRAIMIGDILASNDSILSPVVAAEDLNFSVGADTQSSKRLLRVFLMSKRGQPTAQSEYVSVISHNSQIERAIRIGFAEQYHPCAIQDVIFYINHEVAAPTTGKGLWERIGGVQPTIPPITSPTTGRSLCLGRPTTQPSGLQASSMTLKNLAILIGVVVPFSLIFRRKGRK